MAEQAWTILGGVVGGVAGYFLSGRRPLWGAAGALAGAIVIPPVAASAMPALPSGSPVATYVEQLIPGQTIILRASVGDLVTVLAPSGWGVPTANINVPGFLEIEATSVQAESVTLKIMEAGQGQIQMINGNDWATLSIVTV